MSYNLSLKKTDNAVQASKMGNFSFRMSNSIVNTSFNFSVTELDILLYLFYILEDGKTCYEFSGSEIMKISGKDLRPVDLFYTCDQMNEHAKVKEFNTDTGKFDITNLFSSIKYDSGNISIILNPYALPYMIGIKDKYTILQLYSALVLRSKYSKRMYMLMCEWRSAGKVTYAVSTLRDLLDLSGDEKVVVKSSMKKSMKDIVQSIRDSDGSVSDSDLSPRFRVKEKGSMYSLTSDFVCLVNKCCEHISFYTELEVSAKWGKTGRKISSVVFTIRRKNVSEKFLRENFRTATEMQAVYLYKKRGLSDEQIIEMTENGCTTEKFSQIDRRVEETFAKSGKHPRNRVGYLVTALRNEGFLASRTELAQTAFDLDLKAGRERSRRMADTRRAVISSINMALDAGAELKFFSEQMDSLGITEEDLRKARE